MRPLSKVAPDWWDYTTLDWEILDDAARLTAEDMLRLSRPGFQVVFYDTLEDFYLAEALEYITAWKQATEDRPAGICGPIGPTGQLPLVARLVNELELDLRYARCAGRGRTRPRCTERSGRLRSLLQRVVPGNGDGDRWNEKPSPLLPSPHHIPDERQISIPRCFEHRSHVLVHHLGRQGHWHVLQLHL
jgi:hypothetical protein